MIGRAEMLKSASSTALTVALLLAISACGGSSPPPKEPEPFTNEPTPSAEPGKSAPASSAKVEEAKAALEKQDFAGAKQILEAARAEQPKDAQTAFYLGVAQQGLGDLAAAKKEFQAALELDGKLLDAAINLSALQLDDKEFDGALSVADKALKAAPKHPDLLLNRALALEGAGKLDEATKAYAAAVEAQSGNVELRIAYAELLLKSGNTKQALQELRQAAKTDNVKLLAAISRKFGNAKSFADCVSVLDRALAKQPSADLYVRRGVCRHDLNDDAGAEQDYAAALKQDANFAPAHYYMGLHYRQKGDKKKALEYLDSAVKIAGTEGVGGPAKEAAEQLRKKK